MEQELEQQVTDLEKYHNTADGRVQVWFGLRTIFNDTDELCVKTKELADRYGVGIHMHVAEAKEEKEYTYARFGEGTVKHLEKLGVLGPNLLAVHTVWLTDEEIELFKKRDVKVSHNPASAMRVLGFARIPRMLREGICLSIGTDGASSSNHMDMMKIADEIAFKNRCRSLITGESLGQVASQTMEALHVTNSVVEHMPVFRPLIGMDKVDIINISERIGTYQTSILPFEDCCTVFTPKHPTTKPKLEKIIASQSVLNSNEMIKTAIEGTEVMVITPKTEI